MRVFQTALPAILLSALLIWAMPFCFPQYDDTLIEILRAQSDSSSVLYTMHGDRPAMGWIFQALDERGLLWTGSTVANAIAWAVMAVFSCRIASVFFPQTPAIAVAAGLLTVAPVLLEMQFVIVNNLAHVVAGGQLAILLLVHSYRSRGPWILALAVAVVLIAGGAMVFEYATALALAGAFLLFVLGDRTVDAAYKRRLRIGAIAVAVAGVAGYVGLVLSKDSSFRPGVGAEFVLADGLFRFAKLPFRLATALYQAAGGALFRELGSFSIESYETIAASIAGVALAVVTVWWATRLDSNREQSDADLAYRRDWPSALGILAIAICIGLMPFLLMGRRPNDVDFSSRFFDPVLPYSAVLTASLFLLFLPRRVMWVVLSMISFIAGYATVSKAFAAHEEVAVITQWGEAIRPYIAKDGYTLAIVPSGPPPRYARLADDALTSMLSRNWSLEDRRRFWARADAHTMTPAASSTMRGVKFDKPVRVLLVQFGEDASDISVLDIGQRVFPPAKP